MEAAGIALYFVLTLAVGWLAGRGNRSGRDLHLGGRSTPWVAALISLVATEISAATLLGAPEVSFHGSLLYVQLMAGSLVARYLVAYYFLPAYYDAEVVTVYEFLELRLGSLARKLSAALFVVGRLIADGARLFLASLTLSILFGWSIPLAASLVLIFTALYTLYGGIRAVIWTDVLQACVFLGSGVVIMGAVLSGLGQADQPSAYWWGLLWNEGKLRMVAWGDGSQALTDPFSFQAAFFGGIFLTLATHGTDHDLVQRVLTCRNRQDCIRSLLWSGWVALLVGLLFLGLGLALWLAAQAGQFQAEAGVSPLLTYLKHHASLPLRTLLCAAILAASMSTLSSALSATSATLSNDLLPRRWTDNLAKNRTVTALLALLVWLLTLATASFKAAHPDLDLLRLALSSLTLVYGTLLGFFVTALFTNRRPSPSRCWLATGLGVSCGFGLFFATPLAFEWLVVAGLLVTLGCLLSPGSSSP